MDEKKKKFKNVKKVILVIIAVLLVGAGIYIGTQLKHDPDEGGAVELDFKNIGELATQSAYMKEVKVTEDDRSVFGVTIPFTDSKYIYSYGVEVKAGYDFAQIEWSTDEDAKIIKIKLPEEKILSTELDLKSLEVYYEKESAFKHISVKKQNDDLKELESDAKKTAVENGLYTKARKNAEDLIKAFVGQKYDLEEYKVEFED